MRFEAEVEAGKGRAVWAAIEELAAGYLKQDVAASMGQARADAFVDLILANAAVSTVVDLALPAGFAIAGQTSAAVAGTCKACGRGLASPAVDGAAGRSGARGGASVWEEAATGLLVDADQDTADHGTTDHGTTDHGTTDHGTTDHGTTDHGTTQLERDSAPGAVVRLLAGLPAVGVLDQRAGTLTREVIESIVFDPDTVFRRLVIDPDTRADTWPEPCANGTCTAASRAVPPRPGSATLTTSSPTRSGSRFWPTWPASAGDTTGSRPTATGP